MSLKNNFWKILAAFIATIVTTIFGSSSSKAASALIRTDSQVADSTVEERITRIREEISKSEKPSLVEPQSTSSGWNGLKASKNKGAPGPAWNNWSNSVWNNIWDNSSIWSNF